MQHHVSVIYWLAGVQGGARSQLAASGSVSPRQWRPGAGTEAGLHLASQHCWLIYDQLCVCVFHVHGFSFTLLLFSVAKCGPLWPTLLCSEVLSMGLLSLLS